jgi:polyisoprenoid-binding protein YceI
MSWRAPSFLIFAAWMLCAAPARAENTLVPGGVYKLDPRHTSVTFKISHLGLSYFTGRFDRVEGELTYDPAVPEHNMLDVAIFPASIDTNDADLDEDLQGANWFDAIKYPRATFHSTDIAILDDHSIRITGDFTLHGETHRLSLDTVLVGAGTMPLSTTQIVGFSASTHFDRSIYGIDNLEPLVGDEIKLQIEAEFDKEP